MGESVLDAQMMLPFDTDGAFYDNYKSKGLMEDTEFNTFVKELFYEGMTRTSIYISIFAHTVFVFCTCSIHFCSIICSSYQQNTDVTSTQQKDRNNDVEYEKIQNIAVSPIHFRTFVLFEQSVALLWWKPTFWRLKKIFRQKIRSAYYKEGSCIILKKCRPDSDIFQGLKDTTKIDIATSGLSDRR